MIERYAEVIIRLSNMQRASYDRTIRRAGEHLGDVPLLADLAFANVFYWFEPIHALSPLQNVQTMSTNSTQRQLNDGHSFAVVFVCHKSELVLMRWLPVFRTIAALRGHFKR